jgi:hypothetical protein
MKPHGITSALIIAMAIAFSCGSARADEDELDAAAMAKLLPAATVALEQALKVGEREGKPISGKYEIEKGALQLSVYTAKDGGFREVIVDHKTAAIEKSEKITDTEDLDDAKSQSPGHEQIQILPRNRRRECDQGKCGVSRGQRRSDACGGRRAHGDRHSDERIGGQESDAAIGLAHAACGARDPSHITRRVRNVSIDPLCSFYRSHRLCRTVGRR